MTILTDDFETAFIPWTGTSPAYGGAVEAVQTEPRKGLYNARFYGPSGVYGEDSWVYATFAAEAEIYMRAYFRCFNIPKSTYNNGDYLRLMGFKGTDWHTTCGIIWVDGYVQWYLGYTSGPGSDSIWTIPTEAISTIKWYCLDIYTKINAVTGVSTLWLNGTQILTKTGLDNTVYGNITDAYVGMRKSWPSLASGGEVCTVFADDVIIDTAYVGPRIIAPQLLNARHGGI